MDKEYLNSKLAPEKRTKILLAQMTTEEKVGQMMQVSCSKADIVNDGNESFFVFGEFTDEEIRAFVQERHAGAFLHVIGDKARRIQELALSTRLGIPVLFGIDAIHGHGLHNGATIFPTQLSMSCSWNKELIEKMGTVTAKEIVADGLNWTFSPVLCIGRDLRWGRINETFGEDPYLIGELATALIRGYQGDDLSKQNSILACAKHYIAYGESSGGRDSYDTQISDRKLRELFLPPFTKAVKAGCATVMAGYQTIDGKPMSLNKKALKQILKDELGFKGFVVTDWNNVGNLFEQQKVVNDLKEACKMAIESGNDMMMNTPEFYDIAVELVKKGLVSEQLIDDAVSRILNIKFAMGLFEKVKEQKISDDIFACDEHLEINLNLTRESMVLLENKNSTLPINKKIKKIAVIGPNADDIKAQYGDWTFFTHPIPNEDIIPERPYYTMLEGVKEVAQKKGVEVVYHKGCHILDASNEDITEALKVAAESELIIAVVGDSIAQNGEFKDRAKLELSGAQQKLLEALKALDKPLVVVLVNGKPLAISWIKENADAVLETFNSGMLGGLVAGEILFGLTNPSGKLTISFPYHSGQLPVYYNQLPGWHGGKYIDLPSEALYSFGYGLSYSSYSYSNITLSKSIANQEDIIDVKVDVSNTSDKDGLETVQLYINDHISSLVTPIKQLKGFEKVYLKAGETKTVSIPLFIKDLAIVDEKEMYKIEKGEFTVMVGSDSRDTSLLKTHFTVI